MTINLLPKKQIQKTVSKTLRIIAMLALIINTSMVGALIKPASAAACHGQIIGVKYEDTNGNQQYNNGEPLLPGWTITLEQKINHNWIQKETTTTNAQGHYEFGLGQYGYGTFRVTETMKAGWTNSTPISQEVNFNNDGDRTVNFGNTRTTGTLIVKKIVSGSDEPSSSWMIHVKQEGEEVAGSPAAGTPTGTSYSLSAGTYNINETDGPSGYSASFSENCINGEATVTAGQTTTCTITNTYHQPTGTIKVNKQVDANGDGTFEGGNDAANTLGFRWGINDATPDRGMGTSADVATGDYNINENLASVPGYHFVGWYKNGDEHHFKSEEEEYSCTHPESTTLPTDLEVKDGHTTEITLCNARTNFNIGGSKWNDLNGDGWWQENEPGMPWVINLYKDNELIGTQTGDQDGWYQFTVPAGTYKVCEQMNPNWHQTYPATEDGCHVVNVPQDLPGPANNKGFHFGNTLNTVAGTLSKTAPAQVNDGANIDYTINWAISGNANSTNTTITDPLPANVTFVSAADGGVYDTTTKTITWNLGTQIPGASGSVHFVAKTVSPLANGTVITNIASLKSTEIDPAINATANTTVISGPVLTITKTVDVTTFVNPNSTVNYTVTIKNTGTDTAVNVKLTDLLPAGFIFTDFGGSSHTFTLGNLAAGAQTSVTYKVTVGAQVTAGTYENLAVASADNAGNVTAKVAVEVRVPKVLGEEIPNLKIVKSISKSFINPGDSVIYTVTVTNIGAAKAINVQVQDLLPAGFTFEDKTITKIFSLGDLSAGSSITITYKAISDKSIKPGKYNNLAIAFADNTDKVTATVPVDVRAIQVLGAELPETGASAMDYLYFFIAALILLISLYVFRLTISREE